MIDKNFPSLVGIDKRSDKFAESKRIVEDLHGYADHYRKQEEQRLRRAFELYKKGIPASKTKSSNQYTGNLIFSSVENKTAFITDHRPKFIFLPQKGADTSLAEAYSQVMGDYIWEEASLESKIRRMAKLGAIFGDSFGKVVFNGFKGECDLKVLDTLKFHPDPYADDIYDGAFMGYVYPMRTQEIYARFGVEVPPASIKTELELEMSDTFRAATPITDIAMIREYWINDFSGKWEELEEYNEGNQEFKAQKRYVRDYPKGRVIGMAETGEVLYDTANPLPLKAWHPFIHFGYYPTSGKFWNMGEPEVVEPVVRDFVDLVKNVIVNAKLMANGKTVVNVASGIKPSDVTNDAGDVYSSLIDVNQAMTTDYGKSMPAYVFHMIEFLRQLTDDVIGNQDVFQGKMPKGAPSGITVDFLQEAASRRTRETAKNLEETLVQLGSNYRDMLTLYDDEKIFFVSGADGLQQIKSGELYGDYTVRVQAGSTMATSYSSKTERAIRMFQAQLIDQITALEMIDDPYAQKAAQRLQQLITQTATGGEFATEEGGAERGSPEYEAARSENTSDIS
jgi:hypothetical protein